MNNVQWKAKWITEERFAHLKTINVFHKQMDNCKLPEHREDLKNHHMLLRKQFHVTKTLGVYINITADDYYKLYINGSFVGQGPAPSYHFHYCFNRYDISNYLLPGTNTIAVHVYYQGLINRVWNSGDYRQGMIAEVYMEDKLILCTDSTWKYSLAGEYVGKEIFGYETQYAEDIDSRLKVAGWKEQDFNDLLWKNACVKHSDDHQLVLQETPHLDVYEIKPTVTKQLGEGHYLLDFGHEITGQLKVRACGKSGQIVEIMCGEELEEGKEDNVRCNMRCNCNYRERWIMSGKEDLLEYFDYKAFRYAEIIAPPDALLKESFSAIVRHYPMDESKCTFNSSEPLLNDIWRLCNNGVKYGSQEVFVDCPSREKGQYLGDATVTSHAHLYLSGDLRLFKKSLEDFARSSRICPGLMAVAPCSFMQEIADFSLQWPFQLLNYYMQSGDLEFLRKMYPVAENVLAYFGKYRREDGLLENVKEKWNLVDWPQNLRDDYDFDLSEVVGDGCHNVINAFYCGAIKTVNEIRRHLEISFTDCLPEIREAYIKAFYNKDIKMFRDSTVSNHCALHSNILPLFFGLVPEEAERSIADFIRKKGMHCGVYNTYFLLKGLANSS
jgi:alpha-L-rhamnosidase